LITITATWIKPLHINKGRTIAQTIFRHSNYVKNPEKTDGGDLVVSYACDARTVDEKFRLLKKEYKYITGRTQSKKNNIISYHMRQSFKPGEITSAEAQAVGYELAMR
jgi:hypothetical protein